MKYTKYLTLGLMGCALTFSSCASDWLQNEPTGSASKNEILQNIDNAKLAINGICKIMTSQHAAYGQMFNGEGTIMTLYNEYTGEDFNFPLMSPGWAPIMNCNSMIMHNKHSIYPRYPWYYYYSIIGNVNTILENIDNTQGPKDQVEFLKAEALTFRAYCYSQLVQFYCKTWQDSNNGTSDGVVLRLDTSTGDIPMSSLAKVYEQIYKDLDDAIALYESSGLKRKDVYETALSTICFPDINVAYAIYAKAAITRQDYTNAAKYAKLAKEGYPLMSNEEYNDGFANPNSEWIWGIYSDSNETIYYFSFQTLVAYNGYYANKVGQIVGNRELVDAIPSTDFRRNMFVHKDAFAEPGQDVNSLINTTDGAFNFKMIEDENGKPKPEDPNDPAYKAYKKANEFAAKLKEKSYKPAEIKYPYTHLKFACTDQPGIGCIPMIRASEMLLIEAEANYFLNKTSEAQKNLIALNKDSKRDEAYTCDKTGEDLLNEIIFYRRVELWGEGRSWFDCRRLGRKIVRHTFKDNGNFHATIAGEFDPSLWVIPDKETDYNDALEIPDIK